MWILVSECGSTVMFSLQRTACTRPKVSQARKHDYWLQNVKEGHGKQACGTPPLWSIFRFLVWKTFSPLKNTNLASSESHISPVRPKKSPFFQTSVLKLNNSKLSTKKEANVLNAKIFSSSTFEKPFFFNSTKWLICFIASVQYLLKILLAWSLTLNMPCHSWVPY